MSERIFDTWEWATHPNHQEEPPRFTHSWTMTVHTLSSVSTTNKQETDPRGLLWNFLIMSFCFGINQGTVLAMSALATTNLGDTLGNLSNSLLYGFYTVTALLFASPFVAFVGLKYGLVFGLALCLIYVGSFDIADLVPSAKWPAACIGGTLGGIASGILWVAQGSYYAQNVVLYAKASGQDTNVIRTSFAAKFAAFYLVQLCFQMM